jgi:amino acid transporter
MVSLTIVTVLDPYNDKGLIGTGSTDINASPFVIAVRNAGIDAVPSIMNAVILIAVLSVGTLPSTALLAAWPLSQTTDKRLKS